MADKKSLLLRMRPEVYEALRRWAGDEFRSLNGQVEYVIHKALQSVGRLPSGAEDQKRPQ